VSHTIKKSLQELKRKKLASNPSSGYWRIKGITAPPAIQPALISAEVQPIPADKVIGTGSSSVYVYFLPVYETQAISLGQVRAGATHLQVRSGFRRIQRKLKLL